MPAVTMLNLVLFLIKCGFWPVWLCREVARAAWSGAVEGSGAAWGAAARWWCPTSCDALRDAERLLRQESGSGVAGRAVSIGELQGAQCTVWTLAKNTSNCTQTPLLLLHGFGSAGGLWCRNMAALAQDRPVYAIDILGFGRSSRISFPEGAVAVERLLVESLERWRAAVGLERMIVVGHGFGGYLAAAYAIKQPERLAHLALVDPWGFGERPLDVAQRTAFPLAVRAVGALGQYVRPLSVLRLFGPLGPWLLFKLRPDLLRKFGPEVSARTVSDYLYHCNAQPPSGEVAFHRLCVGFGWARHPMGTQCRLETLRPELAITLVHGSRSWVDRDPGFRVQYHRPESHVSVEVIQGAGHHVYADRPERFNAVLRNLGRRADQATP